MKNKTLVLSCALLLTGALTACNNPIPELVSSEEKTSEAITSENSSEESAPESTDEDGHCDLESVTASVIIANREETAEEYELQVLPREIKLGQEINLENHVQVTKTNCWYIESASDTIEITGDHTFKAVAYGSYDIVLKAGRVKRSITGAVVTAAKEKFNTVFDNFPLDFISSSDMTGFNLVHGTYWATPWTSDSATGIITMRGGITHPTTKVTYSFDLLAQSPDGSSLYFDDHITMNPGYGKSVARKGFGEAFDEISGADFYAQFDAEGDPTGYYILEKGAVTEDGDSNISRFVKSLVGENVWEDYEYYLDSSLDLAVKYTAKNNSATFYPVNASGNIVRTMTVGTSSYSTAIEVEGIGDCELPACEEWLANPVAPEQLDAAETIAAAFDALFEAKAYTAHSYGRWYNPKTDADAECPDGWVFTDTHTELASNFSGYEYVNENIVELKVESCSSNITLVTDGASAPNAGDSEMYFVHENYAYSATGSVNEGVLTYGAANASTSAFDPSYNPQDAEAEVPNIWMSGLVPHYFTSDANVDLLGVCSFESKEIKDNGDIVYGYNTNGGDFDAGLSQSPYYNGLPYFMIDPYTPAGMPSCILFYLAYMDWFLYCDMTITVGADASSVELKVDMNYSETLHYSVGIEFKDFGMDNVSAEAKAVRDAVVNPVLPA